MATQNVPHSNPHSRVSKIKKDKSEAAVVREVGGKSILFVAGKAAGEIQLKRELDYNPGDPVGDISIRVMCISSLLESLSQDANRELDGFIACGFPDARRHYAEVRKYLKPPAESDSTDPLTISLTPIELVPFAVRK